MKYYPKPWRVVYRQRFPEWDVKSSPYIVDASGRFICNMTMTVGHPGTYDELADNTAHDIVNAVNSLEAIYRSFNER